MAATATAADPNHRAGRAPAQATTDGSRRRPLARLTRRGREWRGGVDERVLWLAPVPQSAPSGRAQWADAHAAPQRRADPRAGHWESGEPTRPGRDDPTRVGLVALATAECARALVSAAIWGRWRADAPHRHCRPCAEIAGRLLALRRRRDRPRGSDVESDGGVRS